MTNHRLGGKLGLAINGKRIGGLLFRITPLLSTKNEVGGCEDQATLAFRAPLGNCLRRCYANGLGSTRIVKAIRNRRNRSSVKYDVRVAILQVSRQTTGIGKVHLL